MEAEDASARAAASQFRRRRSEPVHRRPRTVSQNHDLYPAAPEPPPAEGQEEERRAVFRRPLDVRMQRQMKLAQVIGGRDEESLKQDGGRNGRHVRENGYHEGGWEEVRMREGDASEARVARVDGSLFVRKGRNFGEGVGSAAGQGNRMHNGGDLSCTGRGATAGGKVDAGVKERSDRDWGRGEDGGGSHVKTVVTPVRTGPTKLKFKVGGAAAALHSNSPAAGKAPEKDPEPPHKRRRHRLILEENSDDEDEAGLAGGQAVPYSIPERVASATEKKADKKEFPRQRGKASELVGTEPLLPVPSVRKSSRVPKKRVFDGDEDDEDFRKTLRKAESEKHEEEENRPKGESSSDRGTENTDEDEDMVLKSKKGRIQDIYETSTKEKPTPTLTARQRAMQEKDNDQVSNLIEFPDGLTDTQNRRKAKLSEADRQVKRAEAARKRKQQVEKAAKEIQASAIQKILGQDSTRKKREDRILKQRAEIEEEKKAAALVPATNKIRWICGPTGATVSWSRDAELPVIFTSTLPSYPPPREKCAGPSCENAYVYRDSKSKLPLCSLQCYLHIQSCSLVVK